MEDENGDVLRLSIDPEDRSIYDFRIEMDNHIAYLSKEDAIKLAHHILVITK